MPFTNALLQRLQLSHPIIQAPLAGGGDTPALVAAVCNAGGIGFIGGAYLTPEQITQAAREVRAKTSRPFGINLFAPGATLARAVPAADADRALAHVAPFFAELALPAPTPPAAAPSPFAAQFAAALDCGAAAFSFTFGALPPEAVEAIKSRGMFLAGTATNVEEAAALALGASAVQLGTAFLTSNESGVPDAYKAAILAARAHDTRLTRAFSGKAARGIVNRFTREIDRDRGAILPFPLQNTLTRPLRTAAAQAGRAEFLSLWAGQGLGLARREPAAALVARLAREAEAAVARLSGR